MPIEAIWTAAALVTAVAALLMGVIVVGRAIGKVGRSRNQRRRQRLQPLVFAMLDAGDGEAELRPAKMDRRLASEMLSGYARSLSGEATEAIGSQLERSGTVARTIGDLRSLRSWRRARAAYALGDYGSAEAVQPLIETLADSSEEVRAAAARSLGRLKAEAAALPLTRALVSGTVSQAAAAQALITIGRPAAPGLLVVLRGGGAAERAVAARLLGLVGAAGHSLELIECLRDPHPEVRGAAATSLGRLGAADAVEALVGVLDDTSARVRAGGAEALGAIGDPRASSALLDLAQGDTDYDVGRAAARALAAVDPSLLPSAGDPDAPPHLAEIAGLLAVLGEEALVV